MLGEDRVEPLRARQAPVLRQRIDVGLIGEGPFLLRLDQGLLAEVLQLALRGDGNAAAD